MSNGQNELLTARRLATEPQRGEAATKVERRLAAGFSRSVAKSRLQVGAPLLSKNSRGARRFGRRAIQSHRGKKIVAEAQIYRELTLCLGVPVAKITATHICSIITKLTILTILTKM
jgi:hypothetical protein